MTSVLNVDTIADKAGTGPVGLTKQHAAKAWVDFDGSGASYNASFNTSSSTDNGTGDFTNTYASAMGNANYSINIAASRYTAVIADANGFSKTDPTTTTVRTLTSNSSFAASDGDYGCVDIHGDLA